MCFPRRVVLGVLGMLGVFCGLGQDTQDGCHFADDYSLFTPYLLALCV